MGWFVEAINESPGVIPIVIDDEVDIPEFVAGESGNGLEIFGAQPNCLASFRSATTAVGVEGLLANIEQIVPKFIWRTGAGGAPAIYPELFKIPTAGGDFREMGLPQSV